MADLYWTAGQMARDEVEDELGHPIHEPRNHWEAGNTYAHHTNAVGMEIVRVCRRLGDSGFPFSYTHEIRGALSRNDMQTYVQLSYRPSVAGLAASIRQQLALEPVKRKLHELEREGRDEQVSRLRRAARTFHRLWFEATIPETYSYESQRLPPEFAAERSALWAEARRQVWAEIKSL